jgi:MFS family permease
MIAGALGDRYGRRGALLTGTVIFGAGSLMSGRRRRSGQLLLWRGAHRRRRRR